MITNVDKQAKSIIQAGLSYWGYVVSEPSTTFATIQKESANIQNILFYGSKVDETWQETAVLALDLSPYIEARLNWQEWIPTIKQLIEFAPANQDEMTVQLMTRLGTLYRLCGQTQTAVQTHQNSIALAESLQNPLYLGEALHQLASDHIRLGEHAKAQTYCTRAKHYFEQHGDKQYIANVLHLLATINRLQGELTVAEELIRDSLQKHQTERDALSTAKSYYELGNILEQQGRPHEATDAYDIAETLFLKTDNTFDLCRLYIGWGTLHHNLKDYAEADRIFQKADRAYLINSGHRWLLAYLENNIGSNLLTMGDVFTAVPYLYRAVGHWQATGNPMMKSISLGMLARANGIEGKIDLAIEQYNEAIETLADNNAGGFFKKEMMRFIQEKETLEEEYGKG